MKSRALATACLLIGMALPASGHGWLSFEDLQGHNVSLKQLRQSSSSGTVVLTLWDTRCHSSHQAEKELVSLTRRYRDRVAVVEVDPNAADSRASIRDYLTRTGLGLRVLIDPPGGIAERFDVALTTTTWIFDKAGRLRYFGRLEDARHHYARQALREVLAGKPVKTPVTQPAGCPFLHKAP